jgi:hypothetical protein
VWHIVQCISQKGPLFTRLFRVPGCLVALALSASLALVDTPSKNLFGVAGWNSVVIFTLRLVG